MAWDIDFDLPTASFFTPEQEKGVAALFRAIQPSDPERGIPGADDANAARYLGLLLARDPAGPIRIHSDLPKWVINYPQWLASFDAIAKSRFGKPLGEIDASAATTLIKELEAGTLAGFEGNQRAAFTTIWRHCLQGCWSDPRWGGNADRIMWRWLGHLYDPQKVPVGAQEGNHATV
jgi:gluconate 2-dehydrogenase gamma chain